MVDTTGATALEAAVRLMLHHPSRIILAVETMEQLMSRVLWFPILGLVGLAATASSARGQSTPYVGFVYPAGGQQGTTFQVRLGGQRIDI